jgi:NAD(P)-dependent dehydrogenase (short-subunit alcohol dehydrogenase family)
MINQRVALVTGGSRGIGAGIALELARNGLALALMSRSGCEQTAQQVRAASQPALSIAADVTDGDDRTRALQTIEDQFGRLDVLVNNAGVAPEQRNDILEADEASYDRVMTINLKGPYFLTQQVARWMLRRRDQGCQDPMAIVNVTSISSYTASCARGEYCLSKAGLSMATQLYAARLAEAGINVYEIRPGIIETDMTSGVKDKYDKLIADGLTPIRRWGQPSDVARAVAACVLGYLPFSTGEVINVDGGFHQRIL